ncbi:MULTISPECIES: DUF2164 domain-containing protein [Paenibacillus]|uniref:DUF2164 domain-containing protein n=1 Tax=Paenibacillus TaxID=44249 RepID=UPI0022B92191|nr:DUF2164 domain-containing protein [Paenibacillus caseinilyticus]MCZ8520999.1 DUF2164 domain-containing protein [Paenibacillus caseinilyticus]
MFIVKLPKDQKDQLIQRVQAYFEEERGEEIGDLAAEFLLDYMIKELGPFMYNAAIQDVVKVVGEKMTALEEDLHAMEKPVNSKRR